MLLLPSTCSVYSWSPITLLILYLVCSSTTKSHSFPYNTIHSQDARVYNGSLNLWLSPLQKLKNTYMAGICFSLSSVNRFFRQPWILFVSLGNKMFLVDTNEQNDQKWWRGFGEAGLVLRRNQLKLFREFTKRTSQREAKDSLSGGHNVHKELRAVDSIAWKPQGKLRRNLREQSKPLAFCEFNIHGFSDSPGTLYRKIYNGGAIAHWITCLWKACALTKAPWPVDLVNCQPLCFWISISFVVSPLFDENLIILTWWIVSLLNKPTNTNKQTTYPREK